MPVQFEDKTVNYRIKTKGQSVSGRTNEMTWSLMKDRYVVIRNFIPEDIIEMALDMWRADEQFGNAYTEQEVKDITYKNPEDSIGKSKGGYCTPWGIALHGYIHNKLKDYIDMDLRETYSYTRKYERGAYLGSHTDRPSCEISATLCLDYQTDDNTPWKIWLRNDKNYAGVNAEIVKNETQDLTQRERTKHGCKSVSLEPGDILLYQGPNIPHWRDHLLGDESYHIFVHFFNADSRMEDIKGFHTGRNHDVSTAAASYALDLDGRTNRWVKDEDMTEKKELFVEFGENYYGGNHSRLRQLPSGELVNNYDHFELVERRT